MAGIRFKVTGGRRFGGRGGAGRRWKVRLGGGGAAAASKLPSHVLEAVPKGFFEAEAEFFGDAFDSDEDVRVGKSGVR